MLRRGAVNFTHVAWDVNKCRGRAETAGHHHSCPYIDEEDMEITSKDDYEVIKKEDKEMASDEKPLSPISEEILEKYKAPSSYINLSDRYNKLQIVPSQTPLWLGFTASSPIIMRNE